MGVRFGTPAAAAAAALVLGCLIVLLTACGGPGRVSRDGTTCTGQLTGPGPEDGIARARPQTPAYPAITAAFSTAFLDIAQGGSVRRALGTAAGQIDRNLAAHRYYQPSEP